MSTPETRTGTTHPHRNFDSDLTEPPLCGTESTPKCPNARVYQKRNELIYQLAGTRTDLERIHRATERVDAYLFGALESGLALTLPISDRSHKTPA